MQQHTSEELGQQRATNPQQTHTQKAPERCNHAKRTQAAQPHKAHPNGSTKGQPHTPNLNGTTTQNTPKRYNETNTKRTQTVQSQNGAPKRYNHTKRTQKALRNTHTHTHTPKTHQRGTTTQRSPKLHNHRKRTQMVQVVPFGCVLRVWLYSLDAFCGCTVCKCFEWLYRLSAPCHHTQTVQPIKHKKAPKRDTLYRLDAP